MVVVVVVKTQLDRAKAGVPLHVGKPMSAEHYARVMPTS
jgi:hypothetical protein